jgi:hypothetical protein
MKKGEKGNEDWVLRTYRIYRQENQQELNQDTRYTPQSFMESKPLLWGSEIKAGIKRGPLPLLVEGGVESVSNFISGKNGSGFMISTFKFIS